MRLTYKCLEITGEVAYDPSILIKLGRVYDSIIVKIIIPDSYN